MRKPALLLLLIFVGCGKEPQAVSELLQLFTDEAAPFGFDLDIEDYDVRFTELKSGVVGRCHFRGSGFNRGIYIELSQSFWDDADAEERELLLFHELGHCVLGQGHRAVSIMRPTLFRGYFSDRDDFYIPELFQHGADSRRGIIGNDKEGWIE